MQPFALSTASGQGSLVTPTSNFTPSAPCCVSGASLRQPDIATAVATAVTTVTAVLQAAARRLMGVLISAPSVRERPRLPVVADPDPDAEQASGLEDEEHDDQQAVEDRLDREHRQPTGGRAAADERQHRR